MNPQTRRQIEAIHAAETSLVVAVTGGGATAIGQLLGVPGASRTVLEAIVPYHHRALTDWLGAAPDGACSEPTARAMAVAAFTRGQNLAGAADVAGIGATASLASDRPKRGAHRVHVAWQTSGATGGISLDLEKGARARDEEELLASQMVLLAIAEACGLSPFVELSLRAREAIVRRQISAPSAWRELLLGERTHLETGVDHRPPPVLFPGAFNPLHTGHLEMARVAEQQMAKPVIFELSVINVDKLPLDYLEIESRTQQFADQPYVLTRAPTFVEKAQLYPGATFVVGADTITRIGDEKYYGNDVRRRDQALAELERLDCKFLVFGRKCGTRFQTLADLELPDALRQRCIGVPASEFRADVSSTQLRGEA